MELDVNALLYVLLGGGLAGSLGTLISSIKTFKDGSKLREKGTIEDLISQRRTAIEERNTEFNEKNVALDQRDYWRNRAADLEFLLRQEGFEIPPRGAEPRGDV